MKKEFSISVLDILKQELVKWKDVKKALKYHYPSDKSNYEDLFYKLAKRKKIAPPKREWLVVRGGFSLDWLHGEGLEAQYLEWLKDGTDQQYYSTLIQKEKEEYPYSCSFVAWNTMVNLPIEPQTLYHVTMAEIVAHFIWEITFYGPEDKMKKQGEKLLEINKDIKKKLAKGEEVGIPLEEAFKKIKAKNKTRKK